MADQNGKRIRWTSIPFLSSLIYGFATIVGYFYAKSYYGSFGIDILNYVAPTDLLLISIDQIENVAALILKVPSLLGWIVWIILSLPTLLLLTAIASVVLLLALASIVLAIAVVLGAVIAAVRILAIRLCWLWKALWMTVEDRVQRIKRIVRQHTKPQGSARDEGMSPIHVDDDAEVSQKPVGLAAAYQEVMAQSNVSKSFQKDRYFTAAKNIWGIAEETWKKTWVWHRKHLYKLFGKRKDGAPNAQRSPDGAVGTLVRLWQHFKQLWSERVRPWIAPVFWVLFSMYVIGATSLRGREDAKNTHALAENANTGEQPEDHGFFESWTAIIDPSGYLKAFFCLTQQDSCSIPIPLETVYAIPKNLASLEFTDCANKARNNDEGRYVRANFHHDAGSDTRRTTPDCLVYIGATGSMHFFMALSGDSVGGAPDDSADIQSAPPVVVILNSGDCAASRRSDQVPTACPADAGRGAGALGMPPSFAVIVDGRSGAVSAQRCELELKAVIGPFKTGESEVIDQDNKGRKCSVPVPGISKSVSLALSEVNDAIDKIAVGSGLAGPLVLVGRADIRPIKNHKYGSNMKLTQARVEWVKRRLDEKRPALSVSVLTIPGGPSDLEPEDNPCARVVEIYQCPLPEPGPVADVEDATE